MAQGRSLLLSGSLVLLLGGCGFGTLQPLRGLNDQLQRAGTGQSPSLATGWLALISGQSGREQVLLVELGRSMPVPLPGLNRPDAQPLGVSVDGRGERLALVRQLEGRTELVLYNRRTQSLQPLPIKPDGVPRQVNISADGRILAVQVSRGGLWQVDLLELP